jgi:oligosaccharide repeat unit polymerase
MLPFAIALFTYNIRSIIHTGNENNKHKKIILIICCFFTILLLLAASFFTGSRAGIVLTFLAFILSYVVLTRYARTKATFIVIGLVSISAIGILSLMGTSSVVSRLVTENPFIDGRWQIFSNTYSGIQTFFPFGSGPGTFPDIYRLFQPIEQRGFINHAHNDYLELIFDTGLLGIIIIISFFALLIQQYKRNPTAKRHSFFYIQAVSGISLLLFLLHSTVEFNLHDNMNLLFFGLLTGIIFHSTGYKTKVLAKEPKSQSTIK